MIRIAKNDEVEQKTGQNCRVRVLIGFDPVVLSIFKLGVKTVGLGF